MPVFRIPSALRQHTGGAGDIEVEASTVREALVELDAMFPGLATRLLDAAGSIKPFLRIFVGADDISALDGLETRLAAHDEIEIVPAIAGGTGDSHA